jgi:hypothetical protein
MTVLDAGCGSQLSQINLLRGIERCSKGSARPT